MCKASLLVAAHSQPDGLPLLRAVPTVLFRLHRRPVDRQHNRFRKYILHPVHGHTGRMGEHDPPRDLKPTNTNPV